VRLVWPRAERDHLSNAALERLYSYRQDRRWVVTNFVASLDGGVEVGGTSAALSTDADHQVYVLGRMLADVVLVGAGTVTAEGYRGARVEQIDCAARRRHGLSAIPPIAVVTSGHSLTADSPAITDTAVPSLVLTTQACPEPLRNAWAAAGAEILLTGEDHVDLSVGLAMLEDRGLRRVDCEGGPHLFAALLRERLIDELRLTFSPFLLGGDAQRIIAGATHGPMPARLASVLVDGDALLVRYLLDNEEQTVADQT
jgi:riboflavin biosynthesis pyrimidine reductase